MSAPSRAGRRPGLAVGFPAGFIELTRGGQVRTDHFEYELAEVYPDLSRPEREAVLALLAEPEVAALLEEAPEDCRSAFGVVRGEAGLAGVVALTAAALPMPTGGSAATLADDLTAALHGCMDIAIETLPVSGSDLAAVLLRYPDLRRHLERGVLDRHATFPERRADLYLASTAAAGVVVVSCRSIGAAAVAINGLMREIASSFRAG